MADQGEVGEEAPDVVWRALGESSSSLMIDVRTREEWTFVGAPDLSSAGAPLALIEWATFPSMAPNPAFAAEALRAIEKSGAQTVYFLCRSGVRSRAAAERIAAESAAAGKPVRCVNVSEGFEGDCDALGRRGATNGWKAHGLPWRQS